MLPCGLTQQLPFLLNGDSIHASEGLDTVQVTATTAFSSRPGNYKFNAFHVKVTSANHLATAAPKRL